MIENRKSLKMAGQTPETDVREVLAEVTRMTNLAGIGEWQDVEVIAKTIECLVGNLPTSQRHAGLVAASSGMQRASTLAIEARDAIATQLTAVRRGRHATARYHVTGGFRGRP